MIICQTKSAILTQEELYLRMRHSLAVPPSRAGVSIKSEPALARMVGLKRPSVRKVIDRLVEEGILVRRNGSGTYVRKVPAKVDAPLSGGGAFFSESLFNFFEDRQQCREALNADKVIRIGAVIDFMAPSPSEVYHRIFNGLSARANEIGAVVEVNPFTKLRNRKDVKSAIRKASDGYDGLIVSSSDDLLLEILSEQENRPVVYLDFANRDWNLRTDLVPMVSFDLRHAMIDALKRLYSFGHRKIAVVGFSYGALRVANKEEDEILYDHVMGRLGLTFRSSIFLDVDDAKNEKLIKKTFQGSNACTAVYFCDDVALMRAYPILLRQGLIPGENLAVITHSNKGIPLPSGPDWSRMEFDPLQVATLVLDVIVAEMKSDLPDIISLAHKPTWINGGTHHFKT